ncbi:MAG: ABC transporter substrate-binding protein [Christensenellaceae bacterium]
MKRIIALFATVLSALSLITLSACNKPADDLKTLTIVLPDGAPVLTVYNMIADDGLIEGYKTNVKIVSAASDVGVSLKKGEADVGVIPTNVAGKLYNGGTDIKLLSTNIFGVLYMVGKTDLASVEGLKGKTVGLVGLGGTPDLTLKVLMDKAGVEYVESESAVEGKVALKYVTATDTAVLIQGLKSGSLDYAVLGEPAVTMCNEKADTHVVFDLLELWNNQVAPDCYMQAGVVITKKVYEDAALVEKLQNALKDNYNALSSRPENIKDVVRGIGSSTGVDFTAETVSRLKIGYKSAQDSKAGLEVYFNEIIKKAPAFIDKLPDDGFYYC